MSSKWKPWLVWGSAALFTMFQFMMQGSPSVMVPELIQSFGIDSTEVGFLTTAFFYSYIAMQIPSGILIDLFGPKIILLIGCFSASLACLIFSSSHQLWMAKSSRILMGLMCAPGIVATLTLASNWFKSKRFALVVGLTETLAMLGAAFGTFSLALLVHCLGWRKAIFLASLVGFCIALLILIFVQNYPPMQKERKAYLENFSLKNEIIKLSMVFRESQVWIAGFFSGLMFSLFPALFALWGVPFFMDRYQITSPHATTIVSVGYLGAALGGPVIGAFSNFLKKRKVIMIFGSLMTLLLFLAMLYINFSEYWIYPMLFLLGFFVSSYLIAFPLVSEILPQEVKGKSMGFTNTLTLLIGAPILQPLIGKKLSPMDNPLTKCLHEFKVALLLISLAIGLAFILSFFIRETHCENKYPTV